MSHYNENFYEELWQGSLRSAEIVLPKLLEALPPIRSAVDIGCGAGAWLSVLMQCGIEDVRGYDGPWVRPDMLKIPRERFVEMRLDQGFTPDKKYDLALSLEVAEHLPRESAEWFVAALARASDILLFSAAIPFQGGTNHLNEQWPDYWISLFAKQGFVVMDFLRKKLWNETGVEFWYRQNLLLFVQREMVEKIPGNDSADHFHGLSLVHPELYLRKNQPSPSDVLRMPLRQFWKIGIRRTMKWVLGERICHFLSKCFRKKKPTFKKWLER